MIMKKLDIGLFFKRIMVLVTGMAMTILLSSCAGKAENPDAFKAYYVSTNENSILSTDYELKAESSDIEGCVDEIIKVLSQTPDALKFEAPISGNVNIIGYSINDKLLTLNFANTYNELGRTIEILDRAAIVRTITQINGIDYVTFQVDGTPLTDHYGNVIGNMSADTFIYNVGKEISTYEMIELKLYFANASGDKLVPVYRSVVYNSNISMERLAIEQLISGPNTDIAYPTITKECKINSVNVKDGVCYVDFNSAFLNQTAGVTAETALYSIVNTITEFPDVNKVVLSVDGQLSFTYMDFVISGSYERNLDIIE